MKLKVTGTTRKYFLLSFINYFLNLKFREKCALWSRLPTLHCTSPYNLSHALICWQNYTFIEAREDRCILHLTLWLNSSSAAPQPTKPILGSSTYFINNGQRLGLSTSSIKVLLVVFIVLLLSWRYSMWKLVTLVKRVKSVYDNDNKQHNLITVHYVNLYKNKQHNSLITIYYVNLYNNMQHTFLITIHFVNLYNNKQHNLITIDYVKLYNKKEDWSNHSDFTSGFLSNRPTRVRNGFEKKTLSCLTK